LPVDIIYWWFEDGSGGEFTVAAALRPYQRIGENRPEGLRSNRLQIGRFLAVISRPHWPEDQAGA